MTTIENLQIVCYITQLNNFKHYLTLKRRSHDRSLVSPNCFERMNERMNVFIMTSDKPQMKLQRMHTKCRSLHNKNYSLQYDLVYSYYLFVQ